MHHAGIFFGRFEDSLCKAWNDGYMTTMRWLSLSLFCIGSFGIIGNADAEDRGKRKRERDKTTVAAPAPEEQEAAAIEEPSMQEAADAMDLGPADGSAGYDKGFYVQGAGDSPNRLTINGRVQPRFSFFSDEAGDDRVNSHNFSVAAARLGVKGSVYSERIYFKSEVDLGGGRVDLQDFFFDYRFGEGKTRVRVGQFKKPFSRQTLTTDSRLEFTDRSIVDFYFDNGRDLGLELHNGFVDDAQVEWALGIFNGTGAAGVFQPIVVVDPTTMAEEVVGGVTSNVPNKVRPALVGRIGYNANGIEGYAEADLEGGDLRYALAFASMTHFHLGGNSAITRNGVDFVFKQDGVSATGAVYAEMQGPKIGDVEYTGIGGYIQAGYVVDKKYQPAFRYAVITEKGGNSVQEIGAVFNIYRFGHDFKWQNEATLLNTDVGARRKDYRFLSQAQLAF